MKNKAYYKVFSDKKKLNAMLDLRSQGFSLKSLATIFGADFSTIYYHCKKNQTIKNKDVKKFGIISVLSLYHIRSSKPKTYAEYLAESQLRHSQFIS